MPWKWVFDPKNCQKLPLKSAKISKILNQNLDFRGHLWTLRAENTPKSGPFKAQNNALTLPKQLQNNFEKVQKTTFSTPKIVKNDPSKRSKWAYFSSKIYIFGVLYRPLELKIQPKVGLSRSKTMPKHFLNNSKTTSKKCRKRFFRPPKWPNHGCQLGQKCRFLGPFSVYELYFWLTGTEKKIKIVPPDSLRHLKKKRKKNLYVFPKKK